MPELPGENALGDKAGEPPALPGEKTHWSAGNIIELGAKGPTHF